MQTALCYGAVVLTQLTQYRRVTDRRTDRTDGIAVASTALAMRALQRAVMSNEYSVRTSDQIISPK